jgi:hypothetical protein
MQCYGEHLRPKLERKRSHNSKNQNALETSSLRGKWQRRFRIAQVPQWVLVAA